MDSDQLAFNSVDSDQLAFKKPADLNLHCFKKIYQGSIGKVIR